jgi:hypothetical protein
MSEIILIPSNTLHIGVGKVRVNDNIKKTKPSDTKTKPIFLLLNFNTSPFIYGRKYSQFLLLVIFICVSHIKGFQFFPYYITFVRFNPISTEVFNIAFYIKTESISS